jgi:small conductance mechanosensitive channel
MKDEKAIQWIDYVQELIKVYTPKLLLALVCLVIGLWLISRFTTIVRNIMIKREVDVSLVPFLTSIFNFGLKILLFISVATMVGIATTSFIAVLGAAGLAVGLALQGSLSNFAGGVLILLFRPFKVGDLIESDGELGVVQSITVLHTILTTPADNTAILPNGVVANAKILNYTKENNRRVDLTVGIAYKEDVDRAKEVLRNAIKPMNKVLQTPEPFIGILSFGDSSVNLAVRPYCNSADYWDVYFACNEVIKKALDDANIEIPFPQRVVELKK